MPGPIQTALNKLVGVAAGAITGGKRFLENERQNNIEKEKEAAKEAEKTAQEEQEALAVATEADLQNLGASEIEAKAYRLAQERGLADPKRIIYDEAGKPIATYEEMASLLADQSLTGTLSSRLKGKDAVKTRKQLLEGKTHKERVENARLSVGGGRK